MIKALRTLLSWQRAVFVMITIIVILIGWLIIGSLINTHNTDKIVSDYRLQTQSMTTQFRSSITSSSLKDIQNSICNQPTTMNFIAHEDDDLLFINPAVIHDIQSGNCVRTVYFTAGDNGHDSSYWLSRQKGAERAYDSMLNKGDELWQERIIKLPTGQIATIASPQDDSSISLIFLHLPDGGLRGTGFTNTDHQSLQKLYNNQITDIRTVDNVSSYTSTQLTQTLTNLMQTFRPTNLRTLSSGVNTHTPDHSDHANVARYTTLAYKVYLQQTPQPTPTITYYLGYSIRDLPATLNKADSAAKTKAFLAYSIFDGATCHKITLCYTHAIYGSYLQRQYTNPY
jgi:LmbE family N-acetylglucosaminyl deacetylase